MGYSVDEVSQFSTVCSSWLNIYFTPRYVLDVLIYIYDLILNLLYVQHTSWTD